MTTGESESSLQRLDYLVVVGSIIIASTIISLVVRKWNKDNPPVGLVNVNADARAAVIPAGTHLSRAIIMIFFGFGMVSLFMTLLFSITGIWELLPTKLLVRIPKSVQYTSYAVLCLYYGWGILIVRYNPNYTPCYRSIVGNYHIATGGPYAFIRHPMYAAKALFPLIMFGATGFLPFLIGMLSWTALPYQARMEEKQMAELAGHQYLQYIDRTGRFFPKMRSPRSISKSI